MKIDIEQLAQKAKPVLYIHKGLNEELVTVVVNDEWLNEVYQAAIKGGYLDKYCTKAGQEEGFMPHSHIVFDNSGKEIE